MPEKTFVVPVSEKSDKDELEQKHGSPKRRGRRRHAGRDRPVDEVKIKRYGALRERDERRFQRYEAFSRRKSRGQPTPQSRQRVGMVGNVSFKRGLSYLEGRFGRMVSSESVPNEYDAGGADVRQAIDRELERITGEQEKAGRGERIRENPQVLQRKTDVLRMLRKSGLRKLTPSELTGALIYKFGFEPYEMGNSIQVNSSLLNYLNAVCSLPKGPAGIVDGTMSNCINAVRQGVVADMHDLLWRTGEGKKVFSTDEVAGQLGIYERMGLSPDEQKDRNRVATVISHAAGVLESMGLVKKLPRRMGDKDYRWVHAGNMDKVVFSHDETLDYDILWTLYEKGESPLMDFAKPYEFHGRKTGSSSGKYVAARVRESVGRLETEGLVWRERRRQAYHVGLTKAGRDVIRAQNNHEKSMELNDEYPHLLEATRRALLGTYAEGLKAGEKKTLSRMLLGVGVARRMGEGRKPSQISRELGGDYGGGHDGYSKVFNMCKSLGNGIHPWGQVSTENLKKKYVPRIRQMEADRLAEAGTADWMVENILRERPAG